MRQDVAATSFTPDSGAPQAGVLPLPTVKLRNVFLHVTKACNLRCGYCYFSAAKALPNELSREELAAVWPDLVSLRPEKVVLTGGEPLLRADIVELLHDFRDADPGCRVLHCLNTNGHLVTPDLARRLVGLVDEVRVSIDALEARNDSLRGAGNFRTALQALKTLYAVGFEPKALVTVTAESLPDLEALVHLLLSENIRRININPFRPIGRGRAHPAWRPDLTAAREAVERARHRHAVAPNHRVPEIERDTPQNCGVGQFLNIMPDGDVFPCHVLTEKEFRCGNLRNTGLMEICRSTGLLGQLARLDFREIAGLDTQLDRLGHRGACMGNVYPASKTSRVWKSKLPSLNDA